MKIFVLLSILLFIPGMRLCPQASVQAAAVELYFGTEYCYRSTTISMTPIGTVWKPTSKDLTLFLIGSPQDFSLLDYTIPKNNTAPGTWSGFNLVQSSDYPAGYYGYGNIKLL